MKLELKHLAPYLPYGLEMTSSAQGRSAYITTIKRRLKKIEVLTPELLEVMLFLKRKPILHPLSDLTKEIEIDRESFIPIIKLAELFYVNEKYMTTHYTSVKELERWYVVRCCVENDDTRYMDFSVRKENFLSNDYRVIQTLFEWHFDVFNLIPEGLAIDINTIEK